MPIGVSAYVPLANVTLSSSAASVTFSSISQAYRDLVLVMQPTVVDYGDIQMQFNGDTGTNYSWVFMGGNGSSPNSFTASGQNFVLLIDSNGVTTTRSVASTAHIMDYSATDKHKTVLGSFDRADWSTSRSAHRWASTSAITSIVIKTRVSWTAGSTFALYGVSA